ncbi:MAG: hypothetical protein ACP5U2_11320, partial [Bryobacteraceae bacterium]
MATVGVGAKVGASAAGQLVAEASLENLFEFPEGRRVLACMQCGLCTGSCPYGDVIEFPPR